MKAYQVVQFLEPLRCVEVAQGEPHGTQILLKMRAAGVCHSDIHIWEGGYDLGGGQRLHLKERGISLPLTMGHEIVGEIVAVGADAPSQRIGELCLVYPWIGCGRCRICAAGEENLCMQPNFLGVYRDGGYAETVLVPHERYLLPIGDLDPASIAPYACSGLTTYSALKKLDMLDEPVVIFGAGGLGLMALSILKALGGKGAVVVDIDERKREAAREAGALAVIDGNSRQAGQEIRAALGGPGWAAIDLVGSSETAALAFNLLAKGGKLISIGLFGGSAPWSLPLIPLKAVTIQGSYTGTLAELRELLALVRSGAVPAVPIHRRELHEANATLEGLRAGRQIGRAVLVSP